MSERHAASVRGYEGNAVPCSGHCGRTHDDPACPSYIGDAAFVARLPHRCATPAIGGLTVPMQPDWTCAACGRIWRDQRTGNGIQWWAEVRGPTHYPRGETL